MEDDAVSNQVVVLYDFALLVTVVFRYRAVTPEGNPLSEAIELKGKPHSYWLPPESRIATPYYPDT